MLKDLFLLDPDVVFLNHGSFGACPRPVFERYQQWQRQLEVQPVQFLGVALESYLYQAREKLGNYINAYVNDLVFVPNATHGVNIVASSLKLKPGDEILTTDQEYGACNYAWEFISKKTGVYIKKQVIKMPVSSSDEIAEQFWHGVTPKTRVIYLSHITSPTSLSLPIKLICTRAKQEGILTIIDGAHAPGQLTLDVSDLQADFYIGNCHKWMLSPKGAGFLYARTEVQNLIEPLIVSWGYQGRSNISDRSIFIDLLQWTGTKDPSAALSVPSAIDFMQEYHWDEVRVQCHRLLKNTLAQIAEITGIPHLYPIDSDLYQQMATIPIPHVRDIFELKSHLLTDYKIEIPIIEWNNDQFLRISVQGYNTAQDMYRLVKALENLVPSLKI